MDEKDARIVLLEQALEQAQHTIEFLHHCALGTQGYEYRHPDQTIKWLEKFANLVPLRDGCYHSMFKQDCPECQLRVKKNQSRAEANEALGTDF